MTILMSALLLLTVSGALAFAGETEEPTGAPGSESPEAVGAPVADPEAAAETGELEEVVETFEEDEADRDRWIDSPAAKEERDQSRTAFDDLPPSEADDLLNSVFPDLLEQLDSDPARVLSDLHIEEVVGEHAVLVADSEGGSELVESPIPVRSQLPGEEDETVDMSLQDSGSGYGAETPATTEIDLPDSLGGGVDLGGGLGFSSLPGDPGVEADRFGEKDLFFGETATDTDTLIAPLALGVEVFEQLRSPESPESFRFGLSLPAGATVQSDGQGGAEIVDADNKRIASVPAPFAVDAQESEVPVSMEVDGNALVLEVPHRSLEVAYPILVDPELVNEQWYWNGGNTFGLNYWTWQENADYEARNDGGCIPNASCWGGGLYLRSRGNNHWYGANTWGRWVYSAPNTTAYISAATLWTLHGSVNNCATYSPHGWAGLWNGSGYVGLGVYGPLSFYDPDHQTGWVGNTSTRSIHVGIGTGGSPSALACGHDFYVGGALINQDDPENPGVSASGFPSGWFTDAPPFAITALGTDPGLGVRKITFTRDGSPNGQERPVGCNGTAASRCPTSRTETFNVSGLSFDEGKKTATITVEDATGRKTNKTWTTYVDKSKPDVVLTGQLARVTEEDKGGELGGEEVEELPLPVYNLNIKATDVGSEANSDYRKRSGVRKIEVLLDGVKKQEWTQPCSDSCPMEKSYQLKLHNLDSGEHVLSVLATDGVNKTRERTIEFEYFPATGMKDEYVMHHFPLSDGEGNEAEEENPDRPELAVNVMNGNLVYRESDIDIESNAGLDLEVERFYNSQLPPSESSELGEGWTLSQAPELDPDPSEGSGPPTEATMLSASAAFEEDVALPGGSGESQFDPELQALVTKQTDGDFQVIDETGETETAAVFDQGGRVEEVLGPGLSRAVYEYEGGELAGIDIVDPATFAADPSEIESDGQSAPTFHSTFGSSGSGSGGHMKTPADVAIDSSGNLWVVDRGNNRIIRFNAKGEFSWQWGSFGSGNGQLNSPSAIAIGPGGYIWVVDKGNSRVQKFGLFGNYLGQFGSKGTGEGQFAGAGPEGIAIDPKGNVWVTDTYGGRIHVFSESGTFIKSVGSPGIAPGKLAEPTGIDIDPDGTVWVADWLGNRISVFDANGEFLREFGSQGTGDGQFAFPDEVNVDGEGNVWVGDQNNHRIQQFDREGNYLGQLGKAGSGQGQFNFSYPLGIATDAKGALWVTDVNNHRVQRFQIPRPEPAYHSSFGGLGTGDGKFNLPADVAFDRRGYLWILDQANNRIQQFDSSGEFVSKFGSSGAGTGQFDQPAALAVDADGNILVVDKMNHRIQKFDAEGAFLGSIGTAGSGPGQFQRPEGIAVDASGNIWVSDTSNFRIEKFDAAGEFLETVNPPGMGWIEPTGIDSGLDGTIWVTDWQNNRVVVLNEAGQLVRQFGSQGTAAGKFNRPDAIEVDGKGRVWVGDQNNNRIQQFNRYGEFVAQYGSSGSGSGQFSFSYPFGLASAGKRLWVVDRNNNRIQRWEPGHQVPQVSAVGDDDPSVDVETPGGLVSTIEGEEAGEHVYQHEGNLLTSHEDAGGDSTYEYDEAGRMTRVELSSGAWAEIEYGATDGRVKKVKTDSDGPGPKSEKMTLFSYTDAAPPNESRSTTVTPPDAPAITYDIGNDGSVLRWQNALLPPEFEELGGSLVDVENKETAAPINVGEYNLAVKAYSEEGIASIQVYANGDQLISEKHCPQVYEEPAACKKLPDEWVTHTGDHAPGILHLEVLIEDRMGQVASQRFWVNIPYTPPPAPDAPRTPRFAEVLQFREEHGLDLDLNPVQDEFELNDRVFDTINDWIKGEPVAVASRERWGVPLRAREVAELEYRLAYWQQASELIPAWAGANASGSYAGVYLDERAGGLMRVGFTADQASKINSLKLSGGLIAPDRLAGILPTPKHTLSSLESVQAQIATTASSYPGGLVTGARVDIASNSVRVGSSNVEQARSLLLNDLGQQAPISVYYQPHQRERKVGRERIGGMVRAGDEWLPLQCTIGFGAFDRAKKAGSGQAVTVHYALSAGHCGEVGYEAWRRSKPNPTDDEKQKIGVVARSGYEGPVERNTADALAIRLKNPAFVPRRIFQAEGMPLIDVTSVWSPPVGTNLCFSGRKSKNLIRCGPVVSPPEITVEEGGAVEMQLCFEEYVWGGDSGGPVWVEGTGVAVGLVSSGFGGVDEPGLSPQEREEAKSHPKETCAVLLKPYPGFAPSFSVFGHPEMAPLHLVTINNAKP